MKETDPRSAQIELNDKMFPHYLLGRQLAMELVLKAMVQALPAKKVEAIRKQVQTETNLGMDRIQDQDPEKDTPEHVSDCGFVAALLTMGF